ncbi:hypothetical protein FB567DRAFT_116248 [Paraphoma chrysanthemicola]|uniref:Pentatricopeptide repeat protein n=1 Tax=Paraphoma chrysanthemicola TaxID=798071 RepID=A0A8K0VVF4_9PLEO|nr:hypothetical protein FB567DRAFT_116248 [Paraphoma chrysanthemicola]
MLSSYICRQCRYRLSRRIAPARSLQWQPRATFFSLRQDKPPADDEPTQSALANEEPAGAGEGDVSQSRIPIRYEVERRQPQRSAGRYSKHVLDGPEENAETSSRHQRNTWEASNRATHEFPDGAAPGPAAAIDNALGGATRRERDVDRAWEIFEQNYTSRDCEALRKPSLTDGALLKKGRIFQSLLEAVNAKFCKTSTPPAVTPTMVLLKYEQLGIAPPEYWSRVALSYLTYRAIWAVNNPSPKASARDLPSLLLELSSVWRLFFQCKGLKKMTLDTIDTKWNLPAVDTLPEMYHSNNFTMRMQDFHPGLMGSPTLGFCAVYFYILSDAMNAVESLRQQAAPFLLFLERLLASSRVDAVLKETHTSSRFQDLPKDVQKDIVNEINNAPKMAISALGASGDTLTGPTTGDPAANIEAFHLKRIERAIESKASPRKFYGLWRAAEAEFTHNGVCAIPPRIYNAFLSGYMILFQAERCVEVWNHMIAHGIKPDVQSWVALLEGCEKSKDLNGLNGTWTRMLNSGIEPDNHAWTTRVHGLFSLRQVDLGLAALDDMGKRWLAAENAITSPQEKGGKKSRPTTKINNRVKPSVEAINGAITAVVQLPVMYHEKRIQLVQKILAWAGNFQIKPDAITYNSLIQLYLRAGNSAMAFKLLRQMEQEGIPGDAATYTMLISFALENTSFDSLNAKEQTEKIISLFNDVEANGQRLNAPIYGMAINRLLQRYSNHDAVRTIMQHMQERNVAPSAHVYTSLVKFYFQQDPPAITTVDSLVEQFFTAHRIATDRYLFDCVIEGYATHGEVGKMMSVLTRVSKRGGLPGWRALTAVIEALAQDGDIDRARSVVREVEHGTGVAQGGIMGPREAESKFWAAVRAHGVGLENARMGDMMNTGALSGRRDATEEQMMGQAQNKPSTEGESTTGIEHERDPPLPPIEDQEDVHGFLTDEHEDIHSRIQKP